MKAIQRRSAGGLFLVVIVSLALLSGCGNDTTIPSDGTITFFPSDITASIAADTCFDSTVTLLFKDGTPMNDAELTISGAFAYPRQGGGARYTFYNGPCDYPLNLANRRESGFKALTDQHGVYKFAVLVTAATGTFTDTIHAQSGGIGATQAITIE
jgi:hypothetical protein